MLTLRDLTRDITKIDLDDLLSCWTWRVPAVKSVVAVSVLGDLFLVQEDDAVYWLQTDFGELTKVASTVQQFEQYLADEGKLDDWFLPLFVEELIKSGKIVKENEVYGFIKPPVLGGEYTVDNIEPTDLSVHFALTGQIIKQINDLPDGASVNIQFEK